MASEAVLAALSRLEAPVNAGVSTQSFTVNRSGDVVSLLADGSLSVCNINDASGTVFPLLTTSLSTHQSLSSYQFTHVEWNAEGSLVMLWNERFVAVVHTKNLTTHLDEAIDAAKAAKTECEFALLAEVEMQAKKQDITKACFHSLSSYHIVLLLNGADGNSSLLLVDVLTNMTTTYALNFEQTFCSFCFGTDYDWSMLAVFLLAKGTSQIYVLCPLVPNGALVARKHIDAMRAWIDETNPANASKAREFLDAAFSYPSSFSTNSDEGGELLVCAGQATHQMGGGKQMQQLVSTYRAMPCLQGPIVTSSSADGRAIDNGAASKGRGGREATDICVPISWDGGAPVFVLSRCNGEVDFLLASPDTASSFVGPCWRIGTSELPEMLLVESVSVPQLAGKGSLRLLADPVYSHVFHLINDVLCSTYLLSSRWLECAFMRANRAKEGERDDARMDKSPTFCIPMFVHSTFRDDASLSSEENGGEGGGVDTTPLSGVVILNDPMLGHVGLFRRASGQVSAMNLSEQIKLMEFQEKLSRNPHPFQERESSKNTRMSLIEGIEKELESVKKELNESVNMFMPTKELTQAECRKTLTEASNYYEDKLVIPLEKVAGLMIIEMEALRSTYDLQREEELEKGELLKSFDVKQSELNARMGAIKIRIDEQKARAQSMLHKLAEAKTRQLNDHRYVAQLNEWKQTMNRMQAHVDKLERQAKLITGEICQDPVTGSLQKKNSLAAQLGPESPLLKSAPSPARGTSFSVATPEQQKQQHRTTPTPKTPYTPARLIHTASIGETLSNSSTKRPAVLTLSEADVQNCNGLLPGIEKLIADARRNKELLDQELEAIKKGDQVVSSRARPLVPAAGRRKSM